MSKIKKILIIDGFARQTLPMSKAFKKLGCQVTVLCFSKLDVGYASRYPDKKIIFNCKKHEYSKQLEFVHSLIKKNKFDVVIPMTDNSAIYLANNKVELSKYTKIAVNDLKIFDLAIDKLNTMRVCSENNIGSPITLFSSNPIKDIEKSHIKFPIVIKPRTASGSIGFNIIENKEKLSNYNNSNGLFIQEYIPQNTSQFGTEVFRDRKGNFKSLLVNEKPRWFPIDGGSPTINTTIINKKMVQMSKDLLDAMNWNGYANIDFLLDSRDNELKIIEINARISAAVKLNFIAGIDIAKLILENELNQEVTNYNHYTEGVSIRCLLTELLWFIKSKDRFNTKPSIFKILKSKSVIFSWKDPFPFIVFTIQSLMNYKSEMKKRSRK